MQINPLFVQNGQHAIVISEIGTQLENSRRNSACFCFFLCYPYFLINLIALLAGYIISSSFSDWYMIFCVVNTCIGGIVLATFCCWQCCFRQTDREAPLP